MNVILCLDNENGMMFNKRRQSRDKIVVDKICEMFSNSKLWMSEYSAKLFDNKDFIVVDNDYMDNMSISDCCFVEDGIVPIKNVCKYYIFMWNRDYPADKYFDIDLNKMGYDKIKSENFKGNSHDKITLDIYEKRG